MDLFTKACFCLMALFFVLLPVYAVDLNSWTNQTINNEFTVLLPPDWSYFSISTHAGPATGIMDNNDINNVIAIQTSINTNCSKKSQENLEFNLKTFNTKSGIANITPQIYGMDNATEYGKYSDGKIANVFLRTFEGNIIVVFGTYDSIDEAKEESENFEKIAKSVTTLNPAPSDVCASEESKKTTPTLTIKNTVKPTATPTSVPTINFKPMSTPTPLPTQAYSVTAMPTQVYAAAIIPSNTYSATPVPTRDLSITPLPTSYVPPITSYTGTCPCDCNGPDLNCKDFSSHAEAQACFECCKKTNGDCFELDRDNDGNVCESLP